MEQLEGFIPYRPFTKKQNLPTPTFFMKKVGFTVLYHYHLQYLLSLRAILAKKYRHKMFASILCKMISKPNSNPHRSYYFAKQPQRDPMLLLSFHVKQLCKLAGITNLENLEAHAGMSHFI